MCIFEGNNNASPRTIIQNAWHRPVMGCKRRRHHTAEDGGLCAAYWQAKAGRPRSKSVWPANRPACRQTTEKSAVSLFLALSPFQSMGEHSFGMVACLHSQARIGFAARSTRRLAGGAVISRLEVDDIHRSMTLRKMCFECVPSRQRHCSLRLKRVLHRQVDRYMMSSASVARDRRVTWTDPVLDPCMTRAKC